MENGEDSTDSFFKNFQIPGLLYIAKVNVEWQPVYG